MGDSGEERGIVGRKRDERKEWFYESPLLSLLVSYAHSTTTCVGT